MAQVPFKDISYAQGSYNMAANTDQVIAIRMSSGYRSLHLDTKAATNYKNAAKAGKVIIQYHFGGTANPTTEADYFIKACSPFAENDVYCLDVEKGQSVAWVNTFVTRVHELTGCWPLVYMNQSTVKGQNWSPVLKNCGLWLSAPSYSFSSTVPGVPTYVAQQGPTVGGVDTDMWFGTVAALKKYGYHATVATPAPTPAPAPVPTPTPSPAPSPAPVESDKDKEQDAQISALSALVNKIADFLAGIFSGFKK